MRGWDLASPAWPIAGPGWALYWGPSPWGWGPGAGAPDLGVGPSGLPRIPRDPTWIRGWAIPYNARARNVRACPRARARGMNLPRKAVALF